MVSLMIKKKIVGRSGFFVAAGFEQIIKRMKTSACAVPWLCLRADVAAEVKVEFFESLCASFFVQGSSGIVAHRSW